MVADLQQLGLAGTGPLVVEHHRMPNAEAEDVARRLWGVRARASRFPAEKDDTFRLDTGEDAGFVLKVAGPTEQIGDLEFETALMDHVRASTCGVAVPETVAAQDGRVIVPIDDHAGQRRLVRLITMVPGTPLDSSASDPAEREHVGVALARLRQAMAGFRHDFDQRVCAWDVAHLPALAPLLEHIADRPRRTTLERHLDEFNEIVAPRLHELRSQVLHNDFSKSNILVDHDAPEFVTGVVDFGDAVRTAIAIDVSTALLNQLPRTPAGVVGDDLFAQGRDVLRGYLRHADLTELELELVPHLVRGRVVARALITLYRAALLPENETYILRNTEQGWHQLRWFDARTPGEISATLLGAR